MSVATDPETIRKAFDAVDTDGSGVIDSSEVSVVGWFVVGWFVRCWLVVFG